MRIEFDEILINFSSRESKLAQELLQILCLRMFENSTILSSVFIFFFANS